MQFISAEVGSTLQEFFPRFLIFNLRQNSTFFRTDLAS